MPPDFGPLSKRDRLDSLLDQGMVQILLDARIGGVVVPPDLAGDLQLRLNLSRRFGLPIELDTWGVTATLTFSKVPFECTVPWTAIYAIISYVTGEPFLFPDDVPLEMVLEADEEAHADLEDGAVPGQPLPVRREHPGPSLRLVSSEPDTEPEPTPDPPPDLPPDPNETQKRRSHLRVVK